MPADVVNLRQFRKQKARNERQADAAAMRAKFGQTKAEKVTTAKNADLNARRLDQAKRDTQDDDGER